MKTEIRSPKTQAEWDAYYDLRFRVLREPLGQIRGSEHNEGDVSGLHFALFENSVILAIARLDYTSDGLSQVRFVAVEHQQQGKGLGKKIMIAVENQCKADKKEKLILHARDYAVDFYLRLGYTLIEPSYKLFDVLQHFLMEKEFD